MSNSAGSSDDKEYGEAVRIEETMEINVIRHLKKKPDVWHDIQKHFGDENLDPTKIAVIGDRVLSDIIMGNNLGSFTVLVEPFNTSRENFVVKTVRKFENKLIK